MTTLCIGPNRLPPELLYNIVALSSLAELSLWALTCHAVRRIAERYLYRHLTFDQWSSRTRLLLHILSTSQSRASLVRSVAVAARGRPYTSGLLLAALGRLDHLESLSIHGEAPMSLGHSIVAALHANAPLSVFSTDLPADSILASLLSQRSTLTSLQLYARAKEDFVTHLALPSLEHVHAHPNDLQRLVDRYPITSADLFANGTQDLAREHANDNSALTTLSVCISLRDTFTWADLDRFFDTLSLLAPHLERLSLQLSWNRSQSPDPSFLSNIVDFVPSRRYPHLKHLSITGMTEFNDLDASKIVWDPSHRLWTAHPLQEAIASSADEERLVHAWIKASPRLVCVSFPARGSEWRWVGGRGWARMGLGSRSDLFV